MAVLRPTPSTLKTLFALSGNTCSYRRCESTLAKPEWVEVNCDVAHICGEKRGAARYEPAMSDEDRRHFDNLMLLCPSCHRLIDRLDPDGHDPDLLRKMKAAHEGRAPSPEKWTTDAGLVHAAARLLAQFEADLADDNSKARLPRTVPPEFGQMVLRARLDQGLSWAALSKESGVSAQTIQSIEGRKDDHQMLTSTYNKLVRALDLDRRRR